MVDLNALRTNQVIIVATVAVAFLLGAERGAWLIVLLALWIFFVRTTLLALGAVGVTLLVALFAAIVWWMVSQGWLDLGNRQALSWIVLTVLGVLLGVGMSWSHVRRRVSGQASVDRVDA